MASPGRPATAPQTSGATVASLVFSATDSTTARAISLGPSCAGSRPQRPGSRDLAATRSPSSSAALILPAVERSERAPVTVQTAAAAAIPRASGGRRAGAGQPVSGGGRSGGSQDAGRGVQRAAGPVVGVGALLQPASGPAEA